MTDDEGCQVSAATSVGQLHLDMEVPSAKPCSGTVNCCKCSVPSHIMRNLMKGRPEGSDREQRFSHVKQCFQYDGIGHISSECQE